MSFELNKSKKTCQMMQYHGLEEMVQQENFKVSGGRDAPNLQGGQAVELISLVLRHEVSHLERWEAITFK